jgi:hypothetical protein
MIADALNKFLSTADIEPVTKRCHVDDNIENAEGVDLGTAFRERWAQLARASRLIPSNSKSPLSTPYIRVRRA